MVAKIDDGLTTYQRFYKNNKDKAAKHSAEWRARNKDKYRDWQRQWRDTNNEKYMLSRAKTRAKELGLDFNLTVEDIFIPDVCPILGIPLSRKRSQEAKEAGTIPSLDRIDSSKGYVKGNVHVISWRANNIKGDSTLEELKAMVAYLEKLNG